MKDKMFDRILNNISLDPRIQDGTFRIEEETHMEVLREYFVNKGIAESDAIDFSNSVLEGKYPERQAYNAKGILVTFPTPEYKADAIKRGTHFEENPIRKASNVFSNDTAAPAEKPDAVPTPAAAPAKPTGDTKTGLPLSQAAPAAAEPDPAAASSAPAGAPVAEPTPATPIAPQPAPSSTPPVDPTELPPPVPKSPAEKEADKTVIKKMLKGDDYMLEQVSEWISYNAPKLVEQILNHKRP